MHLIRRYIKGEASIARFEVIAPLERFGNLFSKFLAHILFTRNWCISSIINWIRMPRYYLRGIDAVHNVWILKYLYIWIIVHHTMSNWSCQLCLILWILTMKFQDSTSDLIIQQYDQLISRIFKKELVCRRLLAKQRFFFQWTAVHIIRYVHIY